MTLIKSISGIRGTLGGSTGDNLTPVDITKFAAAFGSWVKSASTSNKIVIGRDARPSGPMVSEIISNTLVGMGFEVIDLGLATTPTVEMAVPAEQAGGGIIITASHNPVEWNALKLLNSAGEFLSATEGEDILNRAESDHFEFAGVEDLGSIDRSREYLEYHIEQILKLDLVDAEAIRSKNFKIAVDAVNSVGGLAVPKLLKSLGVDQIVELNCDPTGNFAHNPEPVPAHMQQICSTVLEQSCDLGIAVDPDVDRLAMVMENGEPFGEEYTLVAVADLVLQHTPTSTVNNLSSSQSLRIITERAGQKSYSAAVGEVNVVARMKEQDAAIGGEGNGGIILPELHYGRDALVGIALFLTALANAKESMTTFRKRFPSLVIAKKKVELSASLDVNGILAAMKDKYASERVITDDGVKIEFVSSGNSECIEWIHLRKSNTEPIIRIYAEADTSEAAEALANRTIEEIHGLVSAHP